MGAVKREAVHRLRIARRQIFQPPIQVVIFLVGLDVSRNPDGGMIDQGPGDAALNGHAAQQHDRQVLLRAVEPVVKMAEHIVCLAEAGRAGQFHVTNRWMGGTLTNFATIQKSIERLKKLEAMFADGSVNRYQKKEVLLLQRELDKLEESLGGIKDMDSLPQLAFIIDPNREDIAVKECRKLGIPIVAVTDTNCDPDLIDYVIPGNDDAIRAIRLIVATMANAVQEGRQGEANTEAAPAAEAAAE